MQLQQHHNMLLGAGQHLRPMPYCGRVINIPGWGVWDRKWFTVHSCSRFTVGSRFTHIVWVLVCKHISDVQWSPYFLSGYMVPVLANVGAGHHAMCACTAWTCIRQSAGFLDSDACGQICPIAVREAESSLDKRWSELPVTACHSMSQHVTARHSCRAHWPEGQKFGREMLIPTEYYCSSTTVAG